MRTVLFYRDFRRFSGGHLKVWDYFNHVQQSGDHVARICFSRESVWDASNPWLALREQAQAAWSDVPADIVFLAGLDWKVLDRHAGSPRARPVINLVQHVRHGRPGDPRYKYLGRRAIRICVGEAVGAVLAETGQVNGPIVVIPNGINLDAKAYLAEIHDKEVDVLIAAIKQPRWGAALARALERSGRRVELCSRRLLRSEYLSRVARARVAVFLPHRAEGLYLPPLEGMALETLVVCPRVPGTEYCRDRHNCLRPDYDLESIRAAAETALGLSSDARQRILNEALATLSSHDLAAERAAFLRVLRNVDQLW